MAAVATIGIGTVATAATPAGAAGNCTAVLDSMKVTGGYSAEAYCQDPEWTVVGVGSNLTDATASVSALVAFANATTIRCDETVESKVAGGFQVEIVCAKPASPDLYLAVGQTVTQAAATALSEVHT
jgi:hypothetical protein